MLSFIYFLVRYLSYTSAEEEDGWYSGSLIYDNEDCRAYKHYAEIIEVKILIYFLLSNPCVKMREKNQLIANLEFSRVLGGIFLDMIMSWRECMKSPLMWFLMMNMKKE